LKFQCLACDKLFVYAKKVTVTEPFSMNLKFGESASNGQGDTVGEYGMQQGLKVNETHACPYCNSPDIEEYTAPATPEKQPQSVLVIDLTSGPQIQIDKALLDGYKITARYSKQYILEK
jgi:hypothetical protein